MTIRHASALLARSTRPSSRLFHTTPRRLDTASALPAGRPVGAFRGGQSSQRRPAVASSGSVTKAVPYERTTRLIGFLLGASAGSYGCYYYLYEDYRRSNDLLNEDMYALQAAVNRLTGYVTSLEEKVEAMQSGKKR